MTTNTSHTTRVPGALAAEPVRIRAHNRAVKKLGQWTTERRLDVAGSRGSVVLDLLLPRIEPGEIDIHLDLAVDALMQPPKENPCRPQQDKTWRVPRPTGCSSRSLPDQAGAGAPIDERGPFSPTTLRSTPIPSASSSTVMPGAR
jgi:hypothetical protein